MFRAWWSGGSPITKVGRLLTISLIRALSRTRLLGGEGIFLILAYIASARTRSFPWTQYQMNVLTLETSHTHHCPIPPIVSFYT